MTSFTLGINTGFAINRFPEPEEWARVVAEELRLTSVQLVADLLNPFWPAPVIESEVARIQEATGRYGISIHSLMTSAFTRVNHLLHPHLESRQAWSEWFTRFADLAVRLGARAIGSHFGILSVRDAQDPRRYRERVDEGIRRWQELSFYARDVGLEYIYFETMSIPREMAYTVAEARELFARVNERAGVPMVYCLDVGHAPHPDERDPVSLAQRAGRATRASCTCSRPRRGTAVIGPLSRPTTRAGSSIPRESSPPCAKSGAGMCSWPLRFRTARALSRTIEWWAISGPRWSTGGGFCPAMDRILPHRPRTASGRQGIEECGDHDAGDDARAGPARDRGPGYEETPRPTPQEGEALIRVAAVGGVWLGRAEGLRSRHVPLPAHSRSRAFRRHRAIWRARRGRMPCPAYARGSVWPLSLWCPAADVRIARWAPMPNARLTITLARAATAVLPSMLRPRRRICCPCPTAWTCSTPPSPSLRP